MVIIIIMANAKTTVELLAEAWAIQHRPMTATDHIEESHAFACHSDGSVCDGKTCTGNFRLLCMLSLALDMGSRDMCDDIGNRIIGKSATLDDFIAEWMRREPS